jgi:hypothetical protein
VIASPRSITLSRCAGSIRSSWNEPRSGAVKPDDENCREAFGPTEPPTMKAQLRGGVRLEQQHRVHELRLRLNEQRRVDGVGELRRECEPVDSCHDGTLRAAFSRDEVTCQFAFEGLERTLDGARVGGVEGRRGDVRAARPEPLELPRARRRRRWARRGPRRRRGRWHHVFAGGGSGAGRGGLRRASPFARIIEPSRRCSMGSVDAARTAAATFAGTRGEVLLDDCGR